MSSSLAERLIAERHRRFVGRKRELELFQSAIAASELPFHVLHIFGPGGIGKTSLLGQFARVCVQYKIQLIYVDTRNIEPTIEPFISALRTSMALNAADSPLEVLAAQAGRHVVLLDTYETLAPLDECWRNPDWYAELHQRSRKYYITRLQQTHGQEQHPVLFDYIFLHRDNPAVRPRFIWQENSSLLTDTMRETDRSALLRMVAEHEGEESARLAAQWLARQPQGVLVFRDPQQQPAGFVLMVALHQARSEDLNADPGASATWRYLQNHAPLRQSEGATLFRFWMARDTYQAVSPTQSLIFINFVQQYRLTAPAYTFFSCAEPDFWAAMFAYADLARLKEADFEVGGRSSGSNAILWGEKNWTA